MSKLIDVNGNALKKETVTRVEAMDVKDKVVFVFLPEAQLDIDNAAHTATKPVLCETPFSVSQILKPLEARGHKVTPVFIVERPDVTAQRYYQREGVAIPKGHLTRIETYRLRAREMKAKSGTSQEILLHLKEQQ